jgi:hypothetical protein
MPSTVKWITCLSLVVAILFVGTSDVQGQGWADDFVSDVGHLDQTAGAGGSAFVWNSDTESIDATFTNNGDCDRRFADLGLTYDIHAANVEFSAIITPLSTTINSGSAAGGRIGFFSAADGNTANMVEVTFSDLPDKPRRVAIHGSYADGTGFGGSSANQEYLNFDFGTTYLVSLAVDGPNGEIALDIYEGPDAIGDLLGSLTWQIDPAKELHFDILGMSNPHYDNDSVLEARIHQMSYVPEPATMSLLALGGIALLRRKR